MNVSLRKSLTGIALSCMLLCSTVSAHESTGKKAAKASGYIVLTGCGCLGFLGCLVALKKQPLAGLMGMIPSGYATYRGAYKLIKTVKKSKNKEENEHITP